MGDLKPGDKVYFSDDLDLLFQNDWVITAINGNNATCAIHTDTHGWQSLVVDVSLLRQSRLKGK